MATPAAGSRIWGFDIGVASIGWAVTQQGCNAGALIDAGVRIFPAAVEGDYASGRDESTNAARQLARSMRRQRKRRRQRLGEVGRLLQLHGLLPPGNLDSPAERDHYFKSLDAMLRPPPIAPTVEQHTWIYRLFARGLGSEPLTPYALGRVLYHAAQLRGFKSNAKERANKETGEVYGGIKDTKALMSGRHIAEAFAALDPERPGERIRARHTSRQDREAGVQALLEAQAPHHPGALSGETSNRIFETIFFQRPFEQDTSMLVGRCSLYPERRRAIMALPSLQRLRILQKVNDLEVTLPLPLELPRPLTPDQRRRVCDHLLDGDDLTFTQLRAVLGFPAKPRKTEDGIQPPFHEFNLERSDPKDRLVGDRTRRHLAPALGKTWDDLSLEQRDALVETIFASDDEEDTKSELAERYDLSSEVAEQVIEAAGRLETNRGRFCGDAARALCAALEAAADQPIRLQTAIKQLRADRPEGPAVVERTWDSLPPLIPTHAGVPAFFEDANALRNPVILRVLRELRLVVNALLRKHGKPDVVRVELARDLKKPRAAREEIAKKQRERAADRERARRELVGLGIQRPSEADKEKWLLGEECGWHCPYTGEPLPPSRVFGRDSDAHVEHIIPRHRSLDNSFANKTLATARANHEKAEHAPHTAFSSDPQRWHEILVRVAAFNGASARGKLARFQWTEEEIAKRYDDFTDRHLRDTAYATRLAKDYLSLLFSTGDGIDSSVDATGTRRIETVAGRATSLLGHAWGLYQALLAQPDLPALPPPADDEPKSRVTEKSRADHRHHAVDAIIVAFTEAKAIRDLSIAIQAGRNPREVTTTPPFPDLPSQTVTALDSMVVSYRLSRRASGALHQATYYQAPRADGRRFQRKALKEFSIPEEFARIVDPRIRAAVVAAWEKRPEAAKAPAIFFKSQDNLPRLETVEKITGVRREVTIRAVTLPIDDIATVELKSLDEPKRRLHVKTGDNFCVAVVEPAVEPGGKSKLRFETITLLEAANLIGHRADVRRSLGPEDMLRLLGRLKRSERVKMTVRASEVLRLHEGKHAGLVRICGVSGKEIEAARLNDARTKLQRGHKALKERVRLSPSALAAARAEKVLVGPLGEVTIAND